ncbi:Polysaccharide lyase [Gaiella occulta]|uniref:Polysaccharide lyase n=1 Tax=Gaiella occulta TaxID=1002870 RepID=A0A7M2YZA7_9ACTN|nr:polysaccharide lyase [Gaiella occulta]RDI74839.1 Polysaccharide lyase [Gaiella occulta]
MRLVIAAFAALAVLVTGSAAFAGGSAGILWNGSFASGVASWTDVQAKDGGFTIVPAPAGRAGMAGRFVVRPGDVPIAASGERAEVLKQTGEQAGTVSFWAWSVYFAPGSSSSPGTSWNVFTQWHQSGPTGVQPLSFEITNERGREWLRLRVWGGNADNPVRRAWRLAPLERGRWYDFALEVDWAPDQSGRVAVWLDGRQVVPETQTPTLYTGQSVYLKQGFYRAPSNVTSELYIAGTRRGASLQDIGITPVKKATKAPSRPARATAAPASKVRPAIVGLPKQGTVIRSSLGIWSKKPTRYAYQWQWSTDRGATWMNVKGAVRRTFDVSATFVGASVRVVVTASNAAGSTRAASRPVSPTA